MNVRLAAAVSLLTVSACARDTTGDLRAVVQVHAADEGARVTVAGIGIGSSREDLLRVFPDTLGIPGDGAYLGRLRGDFGTDLDAVTNVTGGAVDRLHLTYAGNPLALAKVFERWREVLVGAGARCEEHSCEWREGDETIAAAQLSRSWYGAKALFVEVNR